MSGFDKIIYCCRELLKTCPSAENARNYLNSRLSTDLQEKFEFGYLPPLDNLLDLTSIIEEEELSKNKLLFELYDKDIEIKRKISFFNDHNLILPYKDVYGNNIAIVGRTLLSEENRKIAGIPKYKNTVFKKTDHLFGLNYAKDFILKENCVFVVEGQFDFIAAFNNNLKNVVAIGSSDLSFNQFALIKRYTNNIYMLLDNDEAGNIGSDRAIEKYSKYSNIKKICISAGFKDLDEYLKEYNPKSLII